MMMHEFSDEQAYETIEELQQAAVLSESEPMRALFEDTAALVAFLMKERDGARSTLRYCEGKWSEERGTMLDRIQSDENALSEIIGTDHHSHRDGPPPRYVEIARAALRSRFEHPTCEERVYAETSEPTP
jgi:hypothetical protein